MSDRGQRSEVGGQRPEPPILSVSPASPERADGRLHVCRLSLSNFRTLALSHFRTSLLCLLPIAYCLLPLPLRADEATRAFLWEQANTQAATAAKPDDFVKAANTFNRLVADGVANGMLFANLGSTLVLAGDGANAAAAFARAERYLGATPETRQGLAAAMALKTGRTQADLPWSRTAFFWHFAFPCPVRVLTALCGWSLFWLGVFCRILFKRRVVHSLAWSLSETCMFTGGLLAVVFAASALVTLAQERHDTATWGGRTFLSSTPAEMEDSP